MLNRPAVPDIDGLDTFAGPSLPLLALGPRRRPARQADRGGRHRCQRDAVRARGRARRRSRSRSSSGRATGSLPNPDYHRPVTDQEKWLFRTVPHYLAWYRVLQFWNSADRMYPAFRADPEWPDTDVSISRQNDKLRRVMTAHVERELADRPGAGGRGAARLPGARQAHAAGQRLVPHAAARRRRAGERARRPGRAPRGGHRVGRRATRPTCSCSAPGSIPTSTSGRWTITGRGGRAAPRSGATTPARTWASRCPGFPNLFCLYGPNTNPVVGSVVFVLECQVNYVVKAIGAMLEHGWSTMECRRDVHDAYNAAGRRRARAARVAASAGAQLLQQRRRAGHHQHAVEAHRLLAHDAGNRMLADFVVTGPERGG